MSDCLFCKIAEGQIPSNKVYEDEVCYAFYDIDPQAPTHFLVIPKMHIASVAEVTQDNAAVVAHIFAVISKVTKELGLESYRVVSNIGEQAGQSVPHSGGGAFAPYKRFRASENLGAGRIYFARAWIKPGNPKAVETAFGRSRRGKVYRTCTSMCCLAGT